MWMEKWRYRMTLSLQGCAKELVTQISYGAGLYPRIRSSFYFPVIW
jgi:hypothetical protein